MTRATTPRLLGIRWLVVGIVATASVSACTGGIPASGIRETPFASGATPTADSSDQLEARVDEVALMLAVPASVSSGADATIEAVVVNHRDGAIAVASTECGLRLALAVDVAFPLDPAGEPWTGVEAALKTFVLSQHHAAGGIPESGRMRLTPNEENCFAGPPAKTVIAAGESSPARAVWRPEFVDGLSLPRGNYDATLTVFVAGLQEAGSKTVDPTAYLPIDLTTTIEVKGDAKPPISAPLAIDALLKDKQFSDWLASAKPSWSGANIFLRSASGPSGIVPAGPVWEIDVYRGDGPDQDWAIAFIDAQLGELASIKFCKPTCSD